MKVSTRVLMYIDHLPGCNRKMNVREAIQNAKTQDEVDGIHQKRFECTCGLDEVIKELNETDI